MLSSSPYVRAIVLSPAMRVGEPAANSRRKAGVLETLGYVVNFRRYSELKEPVFGEKGPDSIRST
jgi:hypothetical protein